MRIAVRAFMALGLSAALLGCAGESEGEGVTTKVLGASNTVTDSLTFLPLYCGAFHGGLYVDFVFIQHQRVVVNEPASRTTITAVAGSKVGIQVTAKSLLYPGLEINFAEYDFTVATGAHTIDIDCEDRFVWME